MRFPVKKSTIRKRFVPPTPSRELSIQNIPTGTASKSPNCYHYCVLSISSEQNQPHYTLAGYKNGEQEPSYLPSGGGERRVPLGAAGERVPRRRARSARPPPQGREPRSGAGRAAAAHRRLRPRCSRSTLPLLRGKRHKSRIQHPARLAAGGPAPDPPRGCRHCGLPPPRGRTGQAPPTRLRALRRERALRATFARAPLPSSPLTPGCRGGGGAAPGLGAAPPFAHPPSRPHTPSASGTAAPCARLRGRKERARRAARPGSALPLATHPTKLRRRLPAAGLGWAGLSSTRVRSAPLAGLG
ncbi:uncharacterized protein LOC114055506 [Empidonax traillii]|uniref:uncharacterized protein LOC114055506 n=1 Tax=Empidonax traillii TaxID=164674 RepID=UPI000FFD4BBB|nr:uncharacterized protein LOC114055506 [Empidonax traillii]